MSIDGSFTMSCQSVVKRSSGMPQARAAETSRVHAPRTGGRKIYAIAGHVAVVVRENEAGNAAACGARGQMQRVPS